MPSPYEVLRVPPGADDGEVEAAYRERLKETHPDLGGSAEAFRAVRAAYAAITADAATPAVTPAPGDVDGPVATVEFLDFDVLVEAGWSVFDDDLFERAAAADLDAAHGEFDVRATESVLEAAERAGHTWPYACRGGACANCAVALVDGGLDMPLNNILPPELIERDVRLSCNAVPRTAEVRVVSNVKHLPGLEELRLPPTRFEMAQRAD